MTDLSVALRIALLDNNYYSNYCCFCFQQAKEKFNIQDEIILETGINLEIFHLINRVLGAEIAANLATEIMCQKCTNLAIKSYNFIIKCNENTRELNNLVSGLLNSSKIENNKSKSLFLVTKGNEVNTYYDKKQSHKCEVTLLKRLQYLVNKSQGGIKKPATIKTDFDYNDSDYIAVDTENDIKQNNHEQIQTVKLSDIIYDIDNLNNRKCKSCLKDYPTLWNLKQHYLRVHAPKSFKCSECPRSFGSSLLLERHKKASHCTVVCSQCGKTYTNTYSLKHHERSHKVRLVCQTCGKVYKGKQSFNNHIKLKLCKKMRKSNAEAEFTCDYCHKKYSTKTALSVHIRLEHENGKALLCEWCSKKFSSISRLRDHIVKHTKQKNFTCDVCDGKFVTKTSLLYHTRTHTGERPYQCGHCDMRFLSASRRSEHVKRHHTVPSLECNVCHSRFRGQASLLRHKKKHCDVRSRSYQCLVPDSLLIYM